MFSQAVIHYPEDEDALKPLRDELAEFRRRAAVKYAEELIFSAETETGQTRGKPAGAGARGGTVTGVPQSAT